MSDRPEMKYNASLSAEPKPQPSMEAIARFLYQLLDDIDTADDLAKNNDALYRNLVRKAHKKRFEVAETDGYDLKFHISN